MCQCNPQIRTSWCGKGNCKPPAPPGTRTDADKVIFLAHSNPNKKTDTEGIYMTACIHCRNKTFLLILPAPQESGFPMLRCAACGLDLSRIGWIADESSVRST